MATNQLNMEVKMKSKRISYQAFLLINILGILLVLAILCGIMT